MEQAESLEGGRERSDHGISHLRRYLAIYPVKYVLVALLEPRLGRVAIACEFAIMEKEPRLGMQLHFALSELLLL